MTKISNNFRLPATPAGDPGTGPLISSIDDGTAQHQNMRITGGAAPTSTTGTVTTATSAVTTGDIGAFNNVTVVVYGTYAGVNITFEVSPDAGTTWVSIVGSRLDGTGTEASTGVLPANTTRGWEFTLPAVNRFRVRATAWTSGTANVIIAAGSMPLEPVVNAIFTKPPYNQKSYTNANVAYAGVTEANPNLTPVTDGVAAAGAANFTVTAGKRLRIQTIYVAFKGAAATATQVNFNLRANPSGTVTNASPVLATLGAAVPATANSFVSQQLNLGPDGIEIPGGWNWGLFNVAAIANAASTVWSTVVGYEF